jgi:hypothetical protein
MFVHLDGQSGIFSRTRSLFSWRFFPAAPSLRAS